MTLRHLCAVFWFLGTLIPVPCAQGQGGSIAQTGKASTERCYDFEVKNDQEKRNITDLHFHFPRGMKPEHMQAPTGWGWTAGADSLSFETPPTNATGTVSPNPVNRMPRRLMVSGSACRRRLKTSQSPPPSTKVRIQQ